MRNRFSYEGKRCLVVGCYSGMGEATARVVRSLGGRVVAADVKRPTTFEHESFHELDLRDTRELDREGRIPGAIHIPRGMMEFRIDPRSASHHEVFSSDKRFVFFCAGGVRSAMIFSHAW